MQFENELASDMFVSLKEMHGVAKDAVETLDKELVKVRKQELVKSRDLLIGLMVPCLLFSGSLKRAQEGMEEFIESEKQNKAKTEKKNDQHPPNA